MNRRRSAFRILTLFLTLAMVCVLVTSVSVVAAADSAASYEPDSLSSDPDVSPTMAVEQLETRDTESEPLQTEENETVPHEDPDTVGESGDDEQVAAFLSSQLGQMLGDSSRNISESQYEDARSFLGDDYDETLGQFVEVAGDTDQADTAESFEEARDRTQELADLREEFDETLEAYEQAVAEGDEERARQLARELDSIAEEISDRSVDLDELLDEIEEATGSDLSDVRETTSETSDETSESAASVAAAELTATNLTVESNTTVSSFREPVTVSGVIDADDEGPLADETLTIVVGEQSHTVETDAEGAFALTYRPVFVPVNASTIPVTYQPADNSPYLGDNTSIEADITEQVPATVTLDNPPETVQYNESLSISGDIVIDANESGSDNLTVADMPVAMSVAGTSLTAGETAPNGSFELTERFPATVESGTAPLTARVTLDETAVTGTTTTNQLSVTETPTSLTVETETAGNETPTVTVSGTLTTEAGEPLADRELDVVLDETSVGTVTTAADGSYEITVPTTELPTDTANPAVQVAFDGSGTNLASTESTTTAALPDAFVTTESIFFGLEMSQLLVFVGGLGLILVGSVLTLISPWGPDWRRLRRSGTEPPTASSDPSEPTLDPADDTPARARSLLDHAEQSLAADDTETAVQIAYTGIRTALTAQVPDTEGTTHWEFYTRCVQDGLDDEQLTQLETVTAVYETATFAPTGVSPDRAETALQAASGLTTRQE